jgi:hypothetical protein
VGNPDDGLGVVGLAVVYQQVLAGRVEPVPAEELVLPPEPVILPDGREHLLAPDVP